MKETPTETFLLNLADGIKPPTPTERKAETDDDRLFDELFAEMKQGR